MDILEINGVKFAEKRNQRGSRMYFEQDIDGFLVVISYDYDGDFDFSHYGEFCEVNGFSHKDFVLRNPNCWRKVDQGNGTDSWERTSFREYPFFKLTNHPQDEVDWYMKNENMPEREAWQKVLDRERKLLRKLIDGSLFAIVVRVDVWKAGIPLGKAEIHGYEVEDYVRLEDVADAVSGNALIDEAMDKAGDALKRLALAVGRQNHGT